MSDLRKKSRRGFFVPSHALRFSTVARQDVDQFHRLREHARDLHLQHEALVRPRRALQRYADNMAGNGRKWKNR